MEVPFKLSIVVIQKFCYHGNEKSLFSTLLDLMRCKLSMGMTQHFISNLHLEEAVAADVVSLLSIRENKDTVSLNLAFCSIFHVKSVLVTAH